MVGGPSIVWTRKTVDDETRIRKSSNNSKSIVGVDAVNFIRIPCVIPCRQDFILPKTLTKFGKDSNTHKTRQERLNI